MKKIIKLITSSIIVFLLIISTCQVSAKADKVFTTDYDAVISLIDTAEDLIFVDVEANISTVSIVLGQAVDLMQGDNCGAMEFLTSAKTLADSGSTDSVAMIALLEAARAAIPQEEETSEASEEEAKTEAEETTALDDENEEISSDPVEETEDVTEESAFETEPEITEETTEEVTENITEAETEAEEILNRPESGLPEFVQDNFQWDVLNTTFSLMVPSNWGNNKSESSFTRYSSETRSGAVSPKAGTLQTSYFMYTTTDADAFSEHEEDLQKVEGVSGFTAVDTTVAGLKGRRINYTWTLGANSFDCEIVCFAHEGTMYAVELLQGNMRTNDFYDVFDRSTGSIVLGVMENETETETTEVETTEQEITEAETTEVETTEPEYSEPETTEAETTEAEIIEPETTETETQPEIPSETETEAETQTEIETQQITEAETQIETETPQETETQPETSSQTESGKTYQSGEGTLAEFTYTINGHTYQFPTSMTDMVEGDLPVDVNDLITYEIYSDASTGGLFNELSNTAYYFLTGTLCNELVGITNMRGYDIPVSLGTVTDLVDLKGDSLSITLYGGVSVGSPESSIIDAFPLFGGMDMDGYAQFIDNDFLYACNVRDDGCRGYVIIKNDAPYYSTMSIICENGYIREICLECIGSNQADGVFLPE